MANVIENIIRAKDEATPTLKAVRTEFAQLATAAKSVPSTVAPGFPPQLKLIKSEMQGVNAAIQTLAPQAGAALAPMQALFSLGAVSLGPISLGIAGLAVTVGVLATAAKKAAEEVAALGKQAETISNLAQSTGVAAANIQGLQTAMRDAGIPVEALVIGFRQLNKAIADQDPYLKQLGITTKDTFQAFLQLSDLFARSADGPNKTAAAVQLLGRSGEQMIPVMNQGAAAMQGMIEQAKAMGIAFSDQTIKSLVAVDNQFDKLKNQVQGLKNEMVLLAVPGVSTVVEKLNDLLAVLHKLPQALDDFHKKMQTAPGFAKLEEWALKSQDIDRMQDKLKELQGIYERFQKAVDGTSAELTKSSKSSTASQLEDFERITAKVKQLEEAWRRVGSLGSVQGPLTQGGSFGGTQNVPTAAEAGIPSPPKPETAPTEREKMLKRLQELLHLTSTQAQLAYADLKRLDDSAAALDIAAKLEKARGISTTPHGGAPVAAGETPGVNPAATSKALQDMIAQQAWANAILVEEAEKTAEAMSQAIEQRLAAVDFGAVVGAWQATVDQILQPAQVANDAMGALFNGLQVGFQNAFSNILRATGALKSVVVEIVKSMVNEVLALLAKLAAAKVFKFIVTLATGLSEGGEVVRRAAGGEVVRRAQGGIVSPIYRAQGGPVGFSDSSFRKAQVGFSPGGFITGPGSETSDSIPAMLSRGEFVVKASVVKKPGMLSFLKAINSGTVNTTNIFQAGVSAPRVASSPSFRIDQDLVRSLSRVSSRPESIRVDLYPNAVRAGVELTSSRGQTATMRSTERRGGDTYVIQAINAHDAIMSLTQPQGELRKAMDRVAIAGAY